MHVLFSFHYIVFFLFANFLFNLFTTREFVFEVISLHKNELSISSEQKK